MENFARLANSDRHFFAPRVSFRALPLLNAKPTTEVEATSILPCLNVKTARLWRAIVPFTHLAREGRMTVTIGRRELLAALGGAAAAWPLGATRAQQREKPRRIGVLMALAADDPESSRRLTAFVQGLQELGWSEGRNVRIDVRWSAGDAARMRVQAAELIVLAPDVVFAIGGGVLASLQQATR